MKKFKVEWSGAKNRNPVYHIIEAENKAVAYAEAVDKYKYSEYPKMGLSWHWGLFGAAYDNPNYGKDESVSESKLTTKQESRVGANSIPTEQDQTADLTKHSPKPKQDQTADLTGIKFVPFTPHVEVGFEDMGGIATHLNKAVSAFEAKGYEFLRIDTIHVDIRPGCIMALFGKQTEYHPYEFLVFRKIDS